VSNDGKPNASNISYTVVFGVAKEFLHTLVIAVFKFRHSTTTAQTNLQQGFKGWASKRREHLQ